MIHTSCIACYNICMSILSNIFRRREPATIQYTVTGAPAVASSWGNKPWANDLFRSGVDAIARCVAKFTLTPVHVFPDGTTSQCDPELTRLLQVEPNRVMTAYDFLYMVTSLLYTRGNVFVYVQRDTEGRVCGLWPLHVSSVDMREDAGGNLFAAITFANGRCTLLPYESLIHLRRHYHDNDVMGSSQSPVGSAVRLAESQNRGIEAAVQTSGQVRGLLKFNGSLAPDERDKLRTRFENLYLSEGSSGVVVTDTSSEFTPLQPYEATISAADQAQVREKIFSYLGISQAIVDGTFDDDIFGAFSESTIEALALQFSLEFSRRLYPGRSDRRVDVSTARINYLSASTIVKVLEHALPAGVLSTNEARGLLGLPPNEKDRTVQSLNFIEVGIADKYQIAKSSNGRIRALDTGDEVDE